MTGIRRIPGSFRDPSGFLFYHNGEVRRQINAVYREHYDHFVESGFYQHLVDAGFLIRHTDLGRNGILSDDAYKVIKPELIPFISYPYEWCFGQLKDAALLTLRIQREALLFDMTLKDASAYNIQFKEGKSIFIDTLSFEKYREGQPWVGYRQFCQHFLAPLALMSYKDVRLNQLCWVYIDGIPLDLASSLLPIWTYLRPSILFHIHLHAKAQRRFSRKTYRGSRRGISRRSLLGIIDSLESSIRRMRCRIGQTEWRDYYQNTNYSSVAWKHKNQIVIQFLSRVQPKTVWDLGTNTGHFSRLAAAQGIRTISFDIDPSAVEQNYQICKEHHITNVLPLLLDITNPSAGIGWANEERMSLRDRGSADTVLALALVHHLVISNNLPFAKIAEFLKDICKSLIIEFIPKHDSQVQRLLSTREDIFSEYTQQNFEAEFSRWFRIEDSTALEDSDRRLYLMLQRKM